jgi:hypothetical protein
MKTGQTNPPEQNKVKLPDTGPNMRVTITLAPFEFGVICGVMKANGCKSITQTVEAIIEDSGIITALLNNGMELDGLGIA